MKPALKKLLPILGSAVLWLQGCGGNSTSLGQVYFPIDVGDVRNLQRTSAGGVASFTQTVESEAPVNGNSVFPFNTVNELGDTVRVDYFGANTSAGINLCGWEDFENNASAQYTPCVFFPYLPDGANVSQSTQMVGTGALANAVSLDYDFTVESFGDVSVPAGTFSNCATNDVDVMNKDSAGNIIEQGMVTLVLCPEIGMVSLTTQDFSFGGGTSVLVSGVIDGMAIP